MIVGKKEDSINSLKFISKELSNNVKLLYNLHKNGIIYTEYTCNKKITKNIYFYIFMIYNIVYTNCVR